MMKRIGRGALLGMLLAAITATGAFAQQGDPATSKEKELLAVIESLKARVEALEGKVGQEKATPPQLENRLALIEDKLTKAEPDDKDFNVFWKDSLRFETADGSIKLRLGGSTAIDYLWASQDRNSTWWRSDIQDGVEFRRARLYMEGSLYDSVDFKWQYDFANDGLAKWKDFYLDFKEIPYAKLRVGQYLQPFSLDRLISSNDSTFLEVALPTDAFTPDRQTGVMLFNSMFEDRLNWGVSLYKHDSSNFGDQFDEDTGWDVAARVAGLPWYENKGEQLLHLGVSYSLQNPDGRDRFQTRPEYHGTAFRFVDTRNPLIATVNRDFWADSINMYNAEAALVYGPFSVQGEYTYTEADTMDADTVDMSGYYVMASWFITGEHRAYKEGVFKNPKPNKNFSLKDGGLGAWELALRYSYVDLEDTGVWGGEQTDYTAGINWYLNPNTRIMFNYIHAEIEHGLSDDNIDMFATRFQFNF